jgi:hypothetical protein
MTGNNLSILSVNVNSLDAPTKRHRIANWVKNKTQTYVAYKRLILLKKKIDTGIESKARKKFSNKWTP